MVRRGLAAVVLVSGCYDPSLADPAIDAAGPAAGTDASVAVDAAPPDIPVGDGTPPSDAADGAAPDARPCEAATGCDWVFECGASCIVYCDELLDWATAKARCEAWFGWLADVHSSPENDCIFSMTPPGVAWIGLFQAETGSEPSGSWQWVTGRPVEFTYWNVNEPNDNGDEDCGTMYLDPTPAGHWNDDTCEELKAFVCERPR